MNPPLIGASAISCIIKGLFTQSGIFYRVVDRGKRMMRYNPPNNWPTPPSGWQPPPDWQPDPSWGPPPENHQFWIDVPEPGFPAEQRGKAITITALILAGVALILCWVPIVNNVVFFLGLIAVVLSIVALVVTVRGRSSMRGMAIAALSVGVLSLIGVLVTQALYSSILNGISEAVGGKGDGASQPQPTLDGRTSTPPSGAGTPKPTLTPGTVNQPLAVGTPANLGREYQVAVASVQLDGNAEVLAANRFNKPPTGQYVLLQLSVTYVGVEEGTPWIDLSPTFVGADARQYRASSCGASLNQSAMDVPTLEKGGNASYQVCMDVPAAAIEGGKIFVDETLSFNDKSRVYWGIR